MSSVESKDVFSPDKEVLSVSNQGKKLEFHGGEWVSFAIVSSAVKDDPDDIWKLRAYKERQVKHRQGLWQELYQHLP